MIKKHFHLPLSELPNDVPPELLRVVALMEQAIEKIGNDHVTSAAWRIADAGLLLRQWLQRRINEQPDTEGLVVGLNCPTGRGALLSPQFHPDPTEEPTE